MVVTTPALGLPKGEGPDNASAYLKGTIAGGGLWRALEILDSAVLTTASLTLDDATLTNPTIGPDEWTNANHAHASAASAGSVLGPGTTLQTPTLNTPAVSGVMTFGGDATLERVAAAQLRVGASVVAQPGSLQTHGAGAALVLGDRTLGAVEYHLFARDNRSLRLQQGGADRAVWSPTGGLTLVPDAGTVALTWPGGLLSTSGVSPVLASATGTNLILNPSAGYMHPSTDGFISIGHPSIKFAAFYSTAGALNPSSREVKEGITPLDPSRAMDAVRNTEAVTFDYVAPTPPPAYYDLPDDPEQAEAVLQQRLTAAPLEAAARHQHGFIAEQADDLFLVGEGQTSPGSSIGVLLAALQNLDQRLAALETP